MSLHADDACCELGRGITSSMSKGIISGRVSTSKADILNIVYNYRSWNDNVMMTAALNVIIGSDVDVSFSFKCNAKQVMVFLTFLTFYELRCTRN